MAELKLLHLTLTPASVALDSGAAHIDWNGHVPHTLLTTQRLLVNYHSLCIFHQHHGEEPMS